MRVTLRARPTRRFSGLMSRCTYPRAWTAESARRIPDASAAASASGSGSSRSTRRSARVGASRYSITTYGAPWAVRPCSWTAGTWGGPTRVSAVISCSR
ncbi:uncharacterized protein SOCEGT47_029970 [Sorangium cellulosum]|uniref:Uncharacterized protein n=1 Tax=Sorangium cellulosum TaxID=56 RepID=A0A4P2PZX6_SORCE|nr:uncharacterized protein SOCEGT47_029970 [Sorangium cellulosum]